MTLKDQVVKNIVSRVLQSKDYRIEIVNLINAEFLQFSIDFFKKVCEKTLKVKERRIFRKVETREEASLAVQEMQDEIYGNTDFHLASDIKR